MRWHKLDLLDSTKHPNIVLGANVSKATEEQLNGLTPVNGYINAAQSGSSVQTRIFTDREYLQPLGTTIMRLYTDKGLELPQNPGW